MKPAHLRQQPGFDPVQSIVGDGSRSWSPMCVEAGRTADRAAGRWWCLRTQAPFAVASTFAQHRGVDGDAHRSHSRCPASEGQSTQVPPPRCRHNGGMPKRTDVGMPNDSDGGIPHIRPKAATGAQADRANVRLRPLHTSRVEH